jgi:hypothetical protein
VNSLDSLNRALAYIDDNLADDIDFRQVERLALCSEYHFRRTFSFLAVFISQVWARFYTISEYYGLKLTEQQKCGMWTGKSKLPLANFE